MQYENQECNLLLIVAEEDGPELLGCNWLHSLPLNWDSLFHLPNKGCLSDVLAKYASVFGDALGTLRSFKAELYVKNTKPIYCKARPVLYTIRSLVESELDKLVRQKILEPLSFSNWAAPIVSVMKPDKSIRICGDFKQTVNKVCDIWTVIQYQKLRSVFYPALAGVSEPPSCIVAFLSWSLSLGHDPLECFLIL